MKYLLALFVICALGSCKSTNQTLDIERYKDQFIDNQISAKGPYHWSFNLMGKQHSTHTFYRDSIAYIMQGKVYSTSYTMKQLSFDKQKNKWIGYDENRNVYVLFFRNLTDSSLMMYKHKCKSDGIEEALAFTKPADDATDDHGWNTYKRNDTQVYDILPISGSYSSDGLSITISDGQIDYNGVSYEKISFHRGERRWVGKYRNQILQVFFKDIEPAKTVSLAVQKFDDPQKAYMTKYHTVNFDTFTLKNN